MGFGRRARYGHLRRWRLPRHVVLLRGINLVRTNRISMLELRAALELDGFRDVKTYVQSGNIVLTSKAVPERVAQRVGALIKKEFGHNIAVVVRSHAELKAIVKRNPLGKVANNPKRHLVTFLGSALPVATRNRLGDVAGPEGRCAGHGKEVYACHADGL